MIVFRKKNKNEMKNVFFGLFLKINKNPNLKYQRSTTLSCKDTYRNKTIRVVSKTHFLCFCDSNFFEN